MSYKNFEKALEFLFPSEGGYGNDKDDKGGPTNMGVTQYTYNYYRRKHNLQPKDVKNITRDEAKKLYYEEYWMTSGADKVTDPRMGILLFDTAVLHGPQKAKEFYNSSGGDINKFLEIRRKSYDSIVAKDSTQKKFYQGWQNRVTNLQNYLKNIDTIDSSSDDDWVASPLVFKLGIEKTENNPSNTSILKDIENSFEPNLTTYKDNNGNEYTYLDDGNPITPEFLDSLSTKDRLIYDKEFNLAADDADNDIVNRAAAQYYNNEHYTKEELDNGVQSGGLIYVKSYTRSDGTKVSGYYRRK